MSTIIFNGRSYYIPDGITPYWRDCETDKKRVAAAVEAWESETLAICTLCWMMPEGFNWEESEVESFDFSSREASYVYYSFNDVVFNPKDQCKEKLEELWILQNPLRRRKVLENTTSYTVVHQ